MGTDTRYAARLVRDGGIVAFPTETSYGFAVDPFNGKAIQRLFALKQRSPKKALLVLLASLQAAERLVSDIPALYHPLLVRYWPGPLTLICPAQPGVPPELSAGTGTIAIRQSSHPMAQELARYCGGAITGTSANLSGCLSANSAEEVLANFPQGLDYILDGGRTAGGKGSTIVRVQDNELCCVRDGAIPFANLQQL